MMQLAPSIDSREVGLLATEQPQVIRRFLRMLLPFVGLLLVIGPFALLDVYDETDPKLAEGFLTIFNFKIILLQTVVVAIAATGMTYVIISGGIDLSVGSIIALAGVATAMVLKAAGGQLGDVGSISHFLVIVAALAGIAAATLAGFLNGAMITGLRIVPFIATLGMLGIARGVAKLLAKEQGVYPPDSWLNFLSWPLSQHFEWSIDKYSFWPGVALLLIVVIVTAFLLNYTRFGRYTTAIGSNEATARLCGVRVNFVRIGIYSFMGMLAGLAGVLQFSRLTMGDPTIAQGLELDVIAAVVIGGGSLSGGEGSILGTLIGAVAMSVLRNGCTLMGWPNYVQEIFIGIFIVVFVAIDQLRRARMA